VLLELERERTEGRRSTGRYFVFLERRLGVRIKQRRLQWREQRKQQRRFQRRLQRKQQRLQRRGWR
jgi:hypothetical protein